MDGSSGLMYIATEMSRTERVNPFSTVAEKPKTIATAPCKPCSGVKVDSTTNGVFKPLEIPGRGTVFAREGQEEAVRQHFAQTNPIQSAKAAAPPKPKTVKEQWAEYHEKKNKAKA